jgi:lipopolysaccharide export system protein LptA
MRWMGWIAAVAMLAIALPPVVGAQPAEAAANQRRPQEPGNPGGLLEAFSLSSKNGPVTIHAKRLEFDYRTRILTYSGDVKVKQEDLTLQSDVLKLTLDPDSSNKVRQVVAEGAVRIAKGARSATGGRAVFDQGTRTVVLSEGAKLRDGPNEVEGERVVVYLDEERSVIEGGDERVRAVLFPPKVTPGSEEEQQGGD